MDEMSLKESTIRKGEKRYGYVSLGVPCDGDLSDEDTLEKANHGLVFLLNALSAHWQVPLAYFLIRSMTAKERANLIRIALRKMHEYGIDTYSMTMDGVSTNLATVEELGAIMDERKTTYQPYFLHPVTKEKVFVFVDPCHDIKNIRNALGTTYNRKTDFELPFRDGEGNIISWKDICELNEIQKDERVHLANKVNDPHIRFEENKMNVRLATQTLSNSVGDALTFLRSATDVVADYKFDKSKGTSIFCKHFNDTFDFFNCRTRYKSDMKQPYCVPLTSDNFDVMRRWAAEKIHYIEGLEHDGVKCISFRRKCAFQSFISCLTHIFDLFLLLRDKHGFLYLLSYKLLQDMIETFFSAVRMCGGFCNNPTPYQFQSAMQKLVTHTQVMWASAGNCEDDDIPVLNVSSSPGQTTSPAEEDDADDEEDSGAFELFNFKDVIIPSAFVQQVVRYISGYIVFQLKLGRAKTACADCLDYVTEPSGTSLLADAKNRGPLKYASEPVIAVGMRVESAIRTNQDNCLRATFAKECSRALTTDADMYNSFQGEHFTNRRDHCTAALLKFIVKFYLTVRLHHEHCISNTVEKYVRRINTKLTLFQHQ